jgi:hypothetical protein
MHTDIKPFAGAFSSIALMDDTAAKWHERRVKSSLAAMRRRAWIIALLACVGLGGAATWLAFAKPQYTSTALVQVDTRNKFSNFDNVLTTPREGDPDVIRTEVEVLRSDAVVQRVVNALGLTNDPEFGAPQTSWLTKFAALLPAELRNAFNSPSIQSDSRNGASDSGGIGSASDSGTAHKSNDSNGLGRAWQLSPQTTVFTNNNGVVLGSISPDAAPRGKELSLVAEALRGA